MVRPDRDIIVLDLMRPDGRRFVTAVGDRADIPAVVRRHKAQDGSAYHWTPDYRSAGPVEGWRLKERFSV